MTDKFTRMSGYPVRLNQIGTSSEYSLATSMEPSELTVSVESIQTISEISSVDVLDTVSNISNIVSIDIVDTVSKIASVVTVSNIDSIKVLDTVSKISNIVTVTEVSNISSVDSIDTVSTISKILNIHQGTVSLSPCDSINNAAIITTIEHAEIHDGDFYEYGNVVTLTASNTYNIGILTGSKEVHYRNEKISTSGDKVIIGLQELATISGGTTVSEVNHNRKSSNTSSVIIKTGVTLATAGTTISIGYIGGGTSQGSNRSGAELSEGNEFILKENTQYCIQIKNNSSETNNVYISPRWYEI